jgi:tRNA threonylcarbamoyladenosine biosynthesis protein TsaB
MSMNVLAIDSSGSVTSIGTGDVSRTGVTVSAEGGRRHAEVIDGLLASVLEESGLTRFDAVCVGVGPGPYSGLRVGIAFGVGLSRAWNVPLVGMCSLDAIAWSTVRHAAADYADGFIVATDARRSEVYWARYNASALRIDGPRVQLRSEAEFALPVISNRDVDPAEMALRTAQLMDAGAPIESVESDWVPHGSDGSSVLVPVGPLLTPRPLYLRAPDVTWSAANSPGGVL